jgi:hypothetical protein
MTRHLLSLTIDTDPDGLSGPNTDRQTLRWDSLACLQHLPDLLNDALSPVCDCVPITWMVRADRQVGEVMGSACYLLDAFDDLWQRVLGLEHEVGWHPHLYERCPRTGRYGLCTDSRRVADQLVSVAEEIAGSLIDRSLFRNGEGWHTAATIGLLEELGVRSDTTAIPGRVGRQGNPMDWTGTPNQPYHPHPDDVRVPGPWRRLLELPINTWAVRGPDESEPKLRCMNPAVQTPVFRESLDHWCSRLADHDQELCVWVLMSHPDEMADVSTDARLYARQVTAVAENLRSMIDRIESSDASAEFVTISQASALWRRQRGQN